MAARGVDSSVSVELWRDAHLDPPAAERVDMLERWASGDSRIVELARELDVPHSRVQTMLTNTVLQLIASHLEDLPRWVQARAAGVEDDVIAELSCVTPTVVSLALDGWPRARAKHASPQSAVEAHRCWRAGGSRAEVAQALGIRVERLIKQLRSGESGLLPHRLMSTDLRERFGWTPSAVSLYRRKGVLPAPGGRDGQRDWWWEASIDEWEAERELWWCGPCRHAFVTPIGLEEHRTRMHS